jgi:uncharacterized protein (DUF1499 family)
MMARSTDRPGKEPAMATRSRSALLSWRLGVLAVLLCGAGVAAAYLGWLAPFGGFLLFAAALVAGGIAAPVLGVIGLVKTRSAPGRGAAVLGTLLGAGLVALLAVLVARSGGAPPIHDLTTSPDDPPVFRELARMPANEGRDLTYPQGGAEVPERQRRAYPDLEPIRLDLAADEAFDAAQRAAAQLGWTVVWSNRELGVIEAYDTSPLFRFVDDVAVRVREAPDGGAVVDLRSTSRVGVSDLGANAKRIRAFAAALRSAQQLLEVRGS